MGFPGSSDSKESAYNAGFPTSISGRGRSPEKEMATHSSILAWEILWTEEPCRLQSMGSQSRTWLKRLGTAHLCMKLCSLLVGVLLCMLGEGECTEMKKYVFFTVGRHPPSLEATDLEHTNWCKALSMGFPGKKDSICVRLFRLASQRILRSGKWAWRRIGLGWERRRQGTQGREKEAHT